MNQPDIENATITSDINQTQIKIQSFKNKTVLVIGLIFLCIWFYLTITVIFTAIGIDDISANEIDVISIYFFIAWLIGTLLIMGLIMWSLLGMETLIIKETQITLSKKILGIGIKNKFKIDEIKNIIFNKVDGEIDLFNRNKLSVWGLGKGKIQFELNKNSYSFGLTLKDKDAVELINFIKRKID